MSLSEVKPGEIATIESIFGGRNLRQKLVNLGVIPGAKVQVIRANKMGPMVLDIQGCQIMVGQRMAQHICVN